LVVNYEALMWIKADVMVVIVLTQIYNDRRLFFGSAPGVGATDAFSSVASSGPNADRRSIRGRGRCLGYVCV
jgi:hypothetical protein